MIECTICLHCNVSGWEYHRDILNIQSTLDERLISLSGEVEHRGFIESMPFDFRLVSGLQKSSIEELSETNVLEINEPMQEYGLPKTLSSLIPIDESQLQDLKECLFLLGNNKAVTLSVMLSVDGLKKDRSDSDRVVPIEGRKMNITSITWKLSCASNL